jgi:hypothetical protein
MKDLHLALALLSIGCGGDALPPARPVVVEVANQSAASLFLAGDQLSFHIRDGGGQTWRPDAAWLPLCSRCDEVCDSDMHGDPIPVWIEVLAGESISLDWEGRLYRTNEAGCSCGWSCADASSLEDGDYELVLEYELVLPEGWGPYDPIDMGDGVLRWEGSELGTASPQLTQAYPITIEGQPSMEVVFDE